MFKGKRRFTQSIPINSIAIVFNRVCMTPFWGYFSNHPTHGPEFFYVLVAKPPFLGKHLLTCTLCLSVCLMHCFCFINLAALLVFLLLSVCCSVVLTHVVVQ